jgi:hypothetical protein
MANGAKNRFKNLGRAIGRDIELHSLNVPEELREEYLLSVFSELGRISLQTRKKGEPPLMGVYELEGLDPDELDYRRSSSDMAAYVKELLHGQYTIINKSNTLRGIYAHFDMTAPFDEKSQE